MMVEKRMLNSWRGSWLHKHSHEHMRRPIGRMLDLETFWGEMFCGSLYSTGKKSLIAVEDCWATCLICPALWLLWLLCMAMTFVIICGLKTEFADVCHIHPWTISMHVPGTSLAWSRVACNTFQDQPHITLVHHLFGPGLCHIHPWTISMHVPGTSLAWSRAT
jgi:hypothetical protein